jgi:hypothetical protein
LYLGIRTALDLPLIVERVEMDLHMIDHAVSRPFRDAFHPVRPMAPPLSADGLKSICQGGRGIATIVRSMEQRFLGVAVGASAVKMTISDEFGRPCPKGD